MSIEDYRGYRTGAEQIPLIDRYRPKTFEEFIGNEDVIKLLKKILTYESTHTFLFTGPIGCGKTSLARIVGETIGAKVTNPNRFYLIRESNTADDRGIEFMRDRLYERLFADITINIFDEAHKLTKDAQDAGLKLFEEPPPDKYFIFCTNEPNKISEALKSRCSIHELSPLLPNETLKLLRRICEGEGWDLPEQVLKSVAKESGGIPREAIKFLELAYHVPNKFIPVKDGNRIFVLQDISDLEYFQFITKNRYNYSSILIGSNDIERIIGKDVIVIQIKSDVGMKRTGSFLRRIDGLPKDIKIIEMPGNEIRSFGDWINKQLIKNDTTTIIQQLDDIINFPPELRFPSLYTATDQFIMSFKELYKLKLPERELIMAPWLLEGDLIMLAADSGTGKSLFAMEIAAACSIGRNAMNGLWTPQKIYPILYVDGEMHWDDIKDRARSFGLFEGLILSKTVYNYKKGYPPLYITEEEIRDFLLKYILTKGIKILVLDNIDSLSSGLDLSSAIQWSPINHWLLNLRSHGVCVILVHHTNRKGSPMGTLARRFNLDYSIVLQNKRSAVNSNSTICAFSIDVDKVRRGLEGLEGKLFICENGEWKVRDLKESEERKRSGRKEDEASKRKKAIIALGIDNGKKQKDIADEVKVRPPYITDVKKSLIEKNILQQIKGTDDYKLSEFGKKWVDRHLKGC